MSAANQAVFLSYASQDAEAARRIAEALRAADIEVWFDKSELVGGDAWDAKIRKQIKECTLFLPIISANTQARAEGYFRLEWKLAADRTHLMADDHPFLFPIVIDDTTDTAARVPERFRERQWMRLDQATPAAIARRLSETLRGDVKRAATPPGALAAPIPKDKPPSTRSTGNKAILYGAMIVGLIGVGYLFIRPFIWSELQSLDSSKATPPASEVERLLEQANALVSAESMARADLTTAIELCEAAAKIEPLNPEVWAIWSRACNLQVFYRFDNSAENRSRAQDYAEKAMRLDPQSPAARFAQAQTWLTMMDYLSPGPDLFNQVMTTLRDLYQEDPTNPNVVLRFGNLLSFLPQSREEGLAMLTTLAEEQPEWAERAWNAIGWGHFFRNEFAAAQEAATRGLSDENHPPILMLNSILDAQWTGDLDTALEYLNRLPANTRWEDWMLAQRVRLLMWRGEPEKVLSFMAKFPRDWVDSQIFNGPKAWLTAEARRAMGLDIAANQDYIRALALVEERLKVDHQEPTLLSHRTQILLRLGRPDEARKSYDLQKEIGFVWLAEWALFEPELVFNEIEASFDSPDFWRTAASLRYLEWYAPIRETPEFQSLLARAEASPKHTPNPKVAEASPIPAKSVAVLAFENRSANADNEYFSDGISEELLNVLTRVEGLKVTARTSAFHFKGKNIPIPDIGRQLGVAYIVEGSVRRAGDLVRITAQLIKADDGFNIWSQTFDRELKDIFAVQDEIAGLVAQELQLKLGVTSPAREVNPEAYSLYLEARHLWNQRGEENFIRAEAALNRALELDPDFAEAHATMADIWAMRATYWSYEGKADTSEEIAKTRASANHALSLNPDLSRPYSALGWACMLEGKWEESRRWHLRAVERSPQDATARFWYGSLLGQIGKLAESEKEIRIAAELDPLSFIITLNLGFFGYIRQDWEESYTYYRKGAELREGDFVPAQAGMAHSAYRLGRTEEAVRLSREVLASWPELPRFSADQFAVWVLHQTGHKTEAEAFVDRVLPEIPPRSYLRGFLLAAIGRWEEALPNFETTPYSARGWVFDSPILDPWREDPRFIAMIDRWGETERYQNFRAAIHDIRQATP